MRVLVQSALVLFLRAGLLTIAKSLDREETDQFDLQLVARDQGAPRQTSQMALRVVVADVNDNYPTFERRVYEAEVDENEADFKVVTLNAHDDDISKWFFFFFSSLILTNSSFNCKHSFCNNKSHISISRSIKFLSSQSLSSAPPPP